MHILILQVAFTVFALVFAILNFPVRAQTGFESVFANAQLRVTIWNTLDQDRYDRCQVAMFRRFIGGNNSVGRWEAYIPKERAWLGGGDLPSMLSAGQSNVNWGLFLGVPRGGFASDQISMGPGRRGREVQYLACGFVQEFTDQSPISCGIAEFPPRYLTSSGYGYTAEERIGYLDDRKLACPAWPALRLKSR